MIINKGKWNQFISDNFSHYNRAIINGKGPTFKPINEPIKNTLVTCVNDCLHVSNYTDLFVCNDIEFFERIDHSKLKTLKYLAIPNKIHKNHQVNSSVSYLNVIEIVKDSFSGDFIIYNLPSHPDDNDFISLPSALSSCNTAGDIIALMPTIKTIDVFGVGGSGYSSLIPTPNIKTLWNPHSGIKGSQNHFSSLKDKNLTIH